MIYFSPKKLYKNVTRKKYRNSIPKNTELKKLQNYKDICNTLLGTAHGIKITPSKHLFTPPAVPILRVTLLVNPVLFLLVLLRRSMPAGPQHHLELLSPMVLPFGS